MKTAIILAWTDYLIVMLHLYFVVKLHLQSRVKSGEKSLGPSIKNSTSEASTEQYHTLCISYVAGKSNRKTTDISTKTFWELFWSSIAATFCKIKKDLSVWTCKPTYSPSSAQKMEIWTATIQSIKKQPVGRLYDTIKSSRTGQILYGPCRQLSTINTFAFVFKKCKHWQRSSSYSFRCTNLAI